MFRPCIDLHEGKVKQIVGGTLAQRASGPVTNFVSEHPATWYANLYRKDGLHGGHVIMLGTGNEIEARSALLAYPGGLQIGGGINRQNAVEWLEAGASHVIVTSWLFQEGNLDWQRLKDLRAAVGKEKLVVDLSCRKRGGDYFVVTDRWQTFTQARICKETIAELENTCAEFLVHAVDVEGLSLGIDTELVSLLSQYCSIPTTYAGGAKSLEDLERVTAISAGRIDLTIGSALDIFGGDGVKYQDAVAFNRRTSRNTGGLDEPL
jgi:phosphoribosylformimino-5-aminoimidazole carboxamide ribotide isomerase